MLQDHQYARGSREAYDKMIEELGASNACRHCFEAFTADNPCWSSSACNSAGTLHVSGECKRCAERIDREHGERKELTFDGEVSFS